MAESDVRRRDSPSVRAVFVGVGIDVYEHFGELRRAAESAELVGALLEEGRGFESSVLDGLSEADAAARLKAALPAGGLPGALLVVSWCGHGEGSEEGSLRLITRDAEPNDTPTLTAEMLASRAVRTGASQVLILLDTCFSGGGLIDAARVVSRLKANLGDLKPAWVGLVASAQEYEWARDGVFFTHLSRVLREGPRDPALRLRYNAFNEGVRGDDVIDAIVQEWDEAAQAPEAISLGRPAVLLANPLFDPNAPGQVVEHLLLAAQGRGPDETGSFFTGRVEQLSLIVEWMSSPAPGVLVVTGPAGSGKSAIAGRVVSLSNPVEREALLADGPVGPDPGEDSVAAHVHARRLTVDRVAGLIDERLCRQGLLRREQQRRNHHELLGELQRLESPPVVVIDGLDEAEAEAWKIAESLVKAMGEYAKVLVATREIEREGQELVATVATMPAIDLGDPRWADQTRADVTEYVYRRLAGVPGSPGVMAPGAVAEALLGMAGGDDEGVFLLARVVTSQLRQGLVDTSRRGWEAALATSVEAALERDLAQVVGSAPCGGDGPVAARQLLTALAWGYGPGVPDDVWAAFATALSPTATTYGLSDPYWALGAIGRYVVAARGGDRAAYRLSHQRLVQHLRPPGEQSDEDPSRERVATAVHGLFDEIVASGDDPADHPYLSLYAWAHCAEAGSPGIDRLRAIVAESAPFSLHLAMALVDQGVSFGEIGRHHDALQVVEEAVAIYRDHASNPALVPDLGRALTILGPVLAQVGRPEEAVLANEEAVAIYRDQAATNPAFGPDLAMTLGVLSGVYSEVNRSHDAVPVAEEAVAIYRDQATTNPAFDPDLAGVLLNLGARFGEVRRLQDAVMVIEEAVAIYRDQAATNPALGPELAGALTALGDAYNAVGRRQDDLLVTEEAVALRRGQAADNPAFDRELAKALISLGSSYRKAGRHDAIDVTEEATALCRTEAVKNPGFIPTLATALTNLSNAYLQEGRHEEAVLVTEEAVALSRAEAAKDPAFNRSLAWALNSRGAVLRGAGRPQDAVPVAEEAVAIYRAEVVENPAVLPDLVVALNNLGIYYRTVQRPHDAVPLAEEAVALYRTAAPDDPESGPKLAASLKSLSDAYNSIGRPHDAVPAAEEAVALYRTATPDDPELEADLASAFNSLGIVYSAVGQSHDAILATEEAATLYRDNVAERPHLGTELATILDNLRSRYWASGRHQDAVPVAEEAVALYRTLATENSAFGPALAVALGELGGVYSEVGRLDDAVLAADESVALYRALTAHDPSRGPQLAGVLNNLGVWYSGLDRSQEAIRVTKEAVALYRASVATDPIFGSELGMALNNLDDRCNEVGRPNDGERAWQTALAALDPFPRALALIERAARRERRGDAASDLAEAHGLITAKTDEMPVAAQLHDLAREQRQRGEEEFDLAWTAAAGARPSWLTLDPALLDLVAEWASSPTYAAAYEIAGRDLDALLDDQALVALDELDLRAGRRDATAEERQILATTKEDGLDAAYRPYLVYEQAWAYLDADPATQRAALADQREDLLTDDVTQAVAAMLDWDRQTHRHGDSLLVLARSGLDEQATVALAAPAKLKVLSDQLAKAGNGPELLALGQLALQSAADDAATARALFYLAIGLSLNGNSRGASGVLSAMTDADPTTSTSLLAELVALAAAQPLLAGLAPALTGAAPAPPGEEPA